MSACQGPHGREELITSHSDLRREHR